MNSVPVDFHGITFSYWFVVFFSRTTSTMSTLRHSKKGSRLKRGTFGRLITATAFADMWLESLFAPAEARRYSQSDQILNHGDRTLNMAVKKGFNYLIIDWWIICSLPTSKEGTFSDMPDTSKLIFNKNLNGEFRENCSSFGYFIKSSVILIRISSNDILVTMEEIFNPMTSLLLGRHWSGMIAHIMWNEND